MDMNMRTMRCPYCGCEQFVCAKQDDYAAVTPANKVLTLKSQKLYHEICLNCGTVVRSYVPNPKNLV
jgi:predicted nucleic-acid-binding Zn-ribbon protein